MAWLYYLGAVTLSVNGDCAVALSGSFSEVLCVRREKMEDTSGILNEAWVTHPTASGSILELNTPLAGSGHSPWTVNNHRGPTSLGTLVSPDAPSWPQGSSVFFAGDTLSPSRVIDPSLSFLIYKDGMTTGESPRLCVSRKLECGLETGVERSHPGKGRTHFKC